MEGESRGSELKGILAWSFGLLSVIFAVLQIGTEFGLLIGLAGIVFGIVGIVLAVRQGKVRKTEWVRAAKVLSIVGLIISVIFVILIIVYLYQILQNPGTIPIPAS